MISVFSSLRVFFDDFFLNHNLFYFFFGNSCSIFVSSSSPMILPIFFLWQSYPIFLLQYLLLICSSCPTSSKLPRSFFSNLYFSDSSMIFASISARLSLQFFCDQLSWNLCLINLCTMVSHDILVVNIIPRDIYSLTDNFY